MKEKKHQRQRLREREKTISKWTDLYGINWRFCHLLHSHIVIAQHLHQKYTTIFGVCLQWTIFDWHNLATVLETEWTLFFSLSYVFFSFPRFCLTKSTFYRNLTDFMMIDSIFDERNCGIVFFICLSFLHDFYFFFF